MLLLVGMMRGSVFHVEVIEWLMIDCQSVSHPPCERREESMKLFREVEYLGVMRGSEVCVCAVVDC